MQVLKNGKLKRSNGISIEPLNWFIKNVQKPALETTAEQGIGFRYKANGDATDGHTEVYAGPVSYSDNNEVKIDPKKTAEIITNQQTQRTNYGVQQNLASYSRTAAATASDIAQGGMTKKEVQDFNMRHPNETALRG